MFIRRQGQQEEKQPTVAEVSEHVSESVTEEALSTEQQPLTAATATAK
jgi:hypothetical protein